MSSKRKSKGTTATDMFMNIDGHTGIVTAERVSPDGKAMVRINDHWLMVE
jgi:hypothetical protein